MKLQVRASHDMLDVKLSIPGEVGQEPLVCADETRVWEKSVRKEFAGISGENVASSRTVKIMQAEIARFAKDSLSRH